MQNWLMPRYLFSLLLAIAVAFFGVLPHAAMAGEMQKTSVSCHNEQTVVSGHSDAMEHCGGPDHAMPGACAIACLGSIAIWFTSSDAVPIAFRPISHRAAVSLVLRGRPGDPADRPPKSI
tara:strand:- start:123 stop:482 length:360 start_codon:yes stop_codon:yes gene_type:complete